MIRIVIFSAIALLCGAFVWLLGARYALCKATATHNGASLVFFTGIHQALLDDNVPSAKRTTELAVGAHLAVIENARKITVAETVRHLLTPGSYMNPTPTLRGVYRHFAKQPDALTPEAMSFLETNEQQRPDQK